MSITEALANLDNLVTLHQFSPTIGCYLTDRASCTKVLVTMIIRASGYRGRSKFTLNNNNNNVTYGISDYERRKQCHVGNFRME